MKNFKKSWKTTFCGLAAIFTGIKTIITTGNFAEALTTITVGIGLIFAKDGDVTGA